MQRIPTGRLASRRERLFKELTALGPVLRATVIERFTQCGKGAVSACGGRNTAPRITWP